MYNYSNYSNYDCHYVCLPMLLELFHVRQYNESRDKLSRLRLGVKSRWSMTEKRLFFADSAGTTSLPEIGDAGAGDAGDGDHHHH